MKKIFNTDYPVTYFLVGLITCVFLSIQLLRFGQTTTAQTIYEFGGLYGQAIKVFPSQSWRLISAIFVHIGWEHFIFNTLTLYFLGRQVEQLYGSVRFLILFFLSGVMGNIFNLFFTPNVIVAGASTAIFGMFAAIVVLRFLVPHPFIQAMGQNYLLLLILNLFSNLFSPNISLSGHIGGAVGGTLLAFILPLYNIKKQENKETSRLAMVMYVALVIVFYTLSVIN